MTQTSEPQAEIKSRRADAHEADLDITPMIDVVFLLLLFFLVVSKMDPQESVVLPKAQYGQTVPVKNCVIFVVTRGSTPDTAYIYRGQSKAESARFTEKDSADLEEQIADYVENELSRRPKVQGVLIKAEGDVRTGYVELVRRAIGRSELGTTRDIYVGVEEIQ